MNELIEVVKKKNCILFVGAGISMNLGLPSWDELIDYIAAELGYDHDVYRTFGNNLTLAEFYEIQKGNIGPLRSWLDRKWHSDSIKIEKSKIHELIVKLDFPIIYTTNYDRWLENAYDYYKKEYRKITNVGDLVNTDKNKPQIIKFHGDFDDDSSIVLTESSYFERLDFNAPLDIKLRADVLGKSILFIGYSLGDINLRYLFYKLNKIWNRSRQSFARPKSYIFLTRPNPIEKAVLERRGITAITSEIDEPNAGIINFLEKLVEEEKV